MILRFIAYSLRVVDNLQFCGNLKYTYTRITVRNRRFKG